MRRFHLIKNTPKVTGFLGSDQQADAPITEKSEAMQILHQVQEGVERPKPSVTLRCGRAGARLRRSVCFLQRCLVEEVDDERARLKVEVSIFGRATPVELEYRSG
jgi:transcriptional antiterminator NusG